MNGVYAVSEDPHCNPQTFSLSSEVVITLSFYLDLFANETKYYQNNNKLGNIFFLITMNIDFYDWFSIKYLTLFNIQFNHINFDLFILVL